MRKIKEVLRLKWERGLSNRQIAAACGVSRPTISEYLRRLAEAGLNWPLPEGLGETQLEQLLFPPPPDLPAQVRGIPDWHQTSDLETTNDNIFFAEQTFNCSAAGRTRLLVNRRLTWAFRARRLTSTRFRR